MSPTYTLAGEVVIRTDDNNITIEGMGPDATRINNNGGAVGIDVDYIGGSPNHVGIVFRGFHLNRTIGVPTVGIQVERFNVQCIIENVRVSNHATAIDFTDSWFAQVRNSWFDTNPIGIDTGNAFNSTTIDNNTFLRSSTAAITSASSLSMTISNNDFEENDVSVAVLDISNCEGFTSLNNHFEENGDGATAGRANIRINACEGVSIIGGRVEGTVTGITPDMDRGLYILDSHGVFFSGITFVSHLNDHLFVDGLSTNVRGVGNFYDDLTQITAPNDVVWNSLGAQVNWNPATVTEFIATEVTIVGAQVGDSVAVGFDDRALPAGVSLYGNVIAADTVSVTIAIHPDWRRVAFDSGGVAELLPGDSIIATVGSGATGVVVQVRLDAGSWAGLDAAGVIYYNQSTGDFLNVEAIDVVTGQVDIATTASATGYTLVLGAELLSVIIQQTLSP